MLLLALLLRICADPNNLPFSNQKQEGLENAVAKVIADDLGATLTWYWLPQRRGFVRNTLNHDHCDVMMEAPVGYERALTTRPWYRSTYVFVSRRGGPHPLSLDDPLLAKLRIGVQTVGNDRSNTPPAHALALRGITNVSGYSVYGDYASEVPQAAIIDAVTRGEVDLAIAWGPLAGWFAPRAEKPLEIWPVQPSTDGPYRFSFSMAMGVKKGNGALAQQLDEAIARQQPKIDALLASFHVPAPPP